MVSINIITSTFQSLYTNLGGCGSTLALIIAILLFSKSKDLRATAKLGLIPGLFNINEPIVYGIPIVFNKQLVIPFIICPLVNVLISYFSMYFGLVNLTNGVQIPWTTPIFFSGFLSSGVSGSILQFCLLIINVVIYWPFIILIDKKR